MKETTLSFIRGRRKLSEGTNCLVRSPQFTGVKLMERVPVCPVNEEEEVFIISVCSDKEP